MTASKAKPAGRAVRVIPVQASINIAHVWNKRVLCTATNVFNDERGYVITGYTGSAAKLKRLVEIAAMDFDDLIQLIETALYSGKGRIGSDIANTLGLSAAQARKEFK